MIYRRHFDPQGEDSLAKLARWIRPGATVLELGAAAGYFTAHLRATGCAVDVVEIDPAAAAEAAAHARRVVVADLDADGWDTALADARYDLVVCADVLEHLRSPARLLERLRERLADGGELLLSVPNVAHGAIVANLVDERFDYGGEGLLDPTHVRLYTWRTLARALRDAGFVVRAWDATTLASYDTEFRVRVESLAPGLRDALAARPHAQVYQWLVRAGIGGPDAGPPPSLAAAEAVPVRLLSAARAAMLSLDHAPSVRVPIGAGALECSWPVAPGSGAVRLLLADRVGVLRVEACRLHAGPSTLWALGEEGAALRCGDGVLAIGAGCYVVTHPDGWVEPVVDPACLARADRMSATLEWPASVAIAGDYAAFTAVIEALVAAHAEREGAARREALELAQKLYAEQREHAETRRARADSERALAQREAHNAQLVAAIDAYKGENARLEGAVAAQERIITERQSLRWWLRLPGLRARLWWRQATGR